MNPTPIPQGRYIVYDQDNVFHQSYSCAIGKEAAFAYAKEAAGRIPNGRVYLQEGTTETLVHPLKD